MQLAWVCSRMQLLGFARHAAARQGLVARAVHSACVSVVWDMRSCPSLKHRDAMQVAAADARQVVGRRLAAGFAVKTLPSIMRELRHDWVDVIKVSSVLGLHASVRNKHSNPIKSPEASPLSGAERKCRSQPCPDPLQQSCRLAR